MNKKNKNNTVMLGAGILFALFFFLPYTAEAVPQSRAVILGGGCSSYSQGYYYGQSYYYGQAYYYAQGYYYGQGYYYAQGTYATTFTTNVTTGGNLDITGELKKGSGTFVIDHPLDPEDKLLYHSFVESPDAKNIYDGVAVLGRSGEAVITLPDYFEALNTDFRYQIKPITNPSPNLHIQSEIKNNQFTIAGGEPGTKISWQVTGVRHDPYILANPITVEVEKGPDALVDKGEFLFPDLKDSYKRPFLKQIGLSFVGFITSIWNIITP